MEDERFSGKVKVKGGRILPLASEHARSGATWGCRAGGREARRVNSDSNSLIDI